MQKTGYGCPLEYIYLSGFSLLTESEFLKLLSSVLKIFKRIVNIKC